MPRGKKNSDNATKQPRNFRNKKQSSAFLAAFRNTLAPQTQQQIAASAEQYVVNTVDLSHLPQNSTLTRQSYAARRRSVANSPASEPYTRTNTSRSSPSETRTGTGTLADTSPVNTSTTCSTPDSSTTGTTTFTRNTSTASVAAIRPVQLQVLDLLHGSSRPANTLLAYTPKQDEFIQYCDYRFPQRMFDSTRYLVDPDKVWDFMWYQSIRECKKRGGDSRRQQKNRFKSEEYASLVNKYSRDLDFFQEDIHPSKGIGLNSFDAYRSALYSKWDDQKANHTNSYQWADIWHAGCKKLRKYVKARGPQQKRRNYVEKLDSNFAPYTVVDSIPRIERVFWDRGCKDTSRRFSTSLSSLRNRYVFLQTVSGILRCESMMKAELSDLVYCSLKKDQDLHKMQLLILQIATGRSLLLRIFVMNYYSNIFSFR
jgi:hypothetical protein